MVGTVTELIPIMYTESAERGHGAGLPQQIAYVNVLNPHVARMRDATMGCPRYSPQPLLRISPVTMPRTNLAGLSRTLLQPDGH